jgi:hypothetical protein
MVWAQEARFPLPGSITSRDAMMSSASYPADPFELACGASCTRATWTSLAEGSERSVDEKIAIRFRVSMTGVIKMPWGNPHQPSRPLKTRLPT